MKRIIALLILIATGWVWATVPYDRMVDFFYDRFEKILTAYVRAGGGEILEGKIEERLGSCHPLMVPPTAFYKRVPGSHIPFAQPVTLDGKSINCEFPGYGKGFSLSPLPKATLVAIRREGLPGTVSLLNGAFELKSDLLHLVLQLPTLNLTLKSDSPLELSVSDDGTVTTIILTKGKLELSAQPRSSVEPLASLVQVVPSANTAIWSEGKLLSDRKPVFVLPAGFQLVENAIQPGPLVLTNLAASQARSVPPHRTSLSDWLARQVRPLDHSARIQMATYFPKFFGIYSLCQFTAMKKNAVPQTIYPGDWIDSAEGGKLHCPEQYEGNVEKNSKFLFDQVGKLPLFYVERGALTIGFAQVPVLLETSAFSVGAQGLGKVQYLRLASSPTEQTLHCSRGSVTLDFGAGEKASALQYLSAQSCRVELALHGGPIKRYLLSGDRVKPANLALPRKFWPLEITGAPTRSPADAGIVLGHSPITSSTLQARWTLPGVLGLPGTCIVYGQKADAEAAMELQKFEVKTYQGEFGVGADYQSGYLSMLCDDGKNTIASNVFLPSSPSLSSGQ